MSEPLGWPPPSRNMDPAPPTPAPRTASRLGGPQDRGPGLWVRTPCLGTGLKQQPLPWCCGRGRSDQALSTSSQKTERGPAPGPTAGLLSQGAAPRQASVMAAQGAVTPGRGPSDGEMAAQGFRGDKRKGVTSRGPLGPTAQTGRAGPRPRLSPGPRSLQPSASLLDTRPLQTKPLVLPTGPPDTGRTHPVFTQMCAQSCVHRVPPAASSLSASLAPLTTAAEQAQN